MPLNQKQRTRTAGFLTSVALLVLGATSLDRTLAVKRQLAGIVIAGFLFGWSLWMDRRRRARVGS